MSNTDLSHACKIASAVLDVCERTRAGHEVLVEDVLDELARDEPPDEYRGARVQEVMHAMAEAGLLHESEGVMEPRFEVPGVEPGECEWCGAPFPEAIRHDVTDYGPDGERLETVHVCSSCLSENY